MRFKIPHYRIQGSSPGSLQGAAGTGPGRGICRRGATRCQPEDIQGSGLGSLQGAAGTGPGRGICRRGATRCQPEDIQGSGLGAPFTLLSRFHSCSSSSFCSAPSGSSFATHGCVTVSIDGPSSSAGGRTACGGRHLRGPHQGHPLPCSRPPDRSWYIWYRDLATDRNQPSFGPSADMVKPLCHRRKTEKNRHQPTFPFPFSSPVHPAEIIKNPGTS